MQLNNSSLMTVQLLSELADFWSFFISISVVQWIYCVSTLSWQCKLLNSDRFKLCKLLRDQEWLSMWPLLRGFIHHPLIQYIVPPKVCCACIMMYDACMFKFWVPIGYSYSLIPINEILIIPGLLCHYVLDEAKLYKFIWRWDFLRFSNY